MRLVSSKIRYARSEDIRLSYLDLDEDCVVVDSSDELMDALEDLDDVQNVTANFDMSEDLLMQSMT